ncbi:predicted protein, partial [Arabidopsis lyrata subsp. lyrata]
LTQPESWSTNAIYKLTTMFASSSKAGLFFKNFLLPREKEDIRTHKKLHFFLYQSLRKTLFNPKAFYLGIVLCVSAALVCLAELEFYGPTSFFMKVILEKRYAMAYRAVDAVTAHFLRIHKETKVMPVIWHQTLLAFVL